MPLKTQDIRITATLPLAPPRALQEALALDAQTARSIAAARRAVARIIARRDSRLLVIVGPCSIHDSEAALDYARKLSRVAHRLRDDLLVLMRVYFEKPRTVLGWKGLVNDPGLDGSFRINDGLFLARKLLLDVARLGLPTANEFLDTTLGQYFADLVSWGCIGARTVESQIHRELASGLSMPVGFKNRTDGNVQVAVEAMRAAAHPHWFPSLTIDGRPAILGTRGNADTHLVLRGGGEGGPNFGAAHVADAAARMRAAGRKPALLIDLSHDNSGKDPARQPLVAADVCQQVAAGQRAIIGVMMESNLLGGRQALVPGQTLVRGQSITDACLGWSETKPVLNQLAAAVRRRRRRA